MENTYVAFAIVLLLFAVISSKKKKTFFDWSMLLYLGLALFGEFYSLCGRKYWDLVPNTIVGYAISEVVQFYFFSRLVAKDTGKKRVVPYTFVLLLMTLLIFFFTDISTEVFVSTDIAPTVRKWFNYHQYYDFTSIASLGYLVNTFYWLHYIIRDSEKTSEELTKRYIAILGILIFYGGTIFILAFGRLLLTDYSLWMILMSSVYRPLYLMSYVIITLAVRWKSRPLSP